MVKHIIIWKLQDKCFGPNIDSIKTNMKTRLEDLNGKIPGVQSIVVHTDCLSSSNGDVAMEAVFDNEEAVKSYKQNELRLEVTKEVVVPFVDVTTHVEFKL
ncbi:Dabb family protein [Pseudobutyrivibrio xylanivorans]|uniref:Stress responsive A/B Barrel Domain n=1 Tax=Pseudobutyrivibrio xylanivorans DSM 14809 TaxID=1123012 RepID=A0A1M6L959_PSEXY|nr:Dabb family protein [Pseudobutyrivibrio xylanivorans]SHJ67741.1 Stress responsive A/B Barrel Domain [Pseudobutyrivibrio xylanivorans DSM 14809]